MARPSERWSSCRRRSSSASSRSAATTRAPVSRKPGGHAGVLLELGRERGPALAPGQAQPQRRLLAEVGLGHRREHPGGDPRRAGARLVRALHHEHRQAAAAGAATRWRGRRGRRRSPRRRSVSFAASSSPSLRRHYPVQVPRSAAPQPPSQPGRPSSRTYAVNRIGAWGTRPAAGGRWRRRTSRA